MHYYDPEVIHERRSAYAMQIYALQLTTCPISEALIPLAAKASIQAADIMIAALNERWKQEVGE